MHLEKSKCCICISDQTSCSYTSEIFYTVSSLISLGREFQIWGPKLQRLLFPIFCSIILIKVCIEWSMCQICGFRENFLHVIRVHVIHSFDISSARHLRRFISIVVLPDFFKSSA